MEQSGSTKSDKLISDYLSRHSASAAKESPQGRQSLGRQPLAALENLQAALSNLHVAYDLNKAAKKAESTPVSQCVAEARSDEVRLDVDEVQARHSNDTEQQSSRLQSHLILCSPSPETTCTSFTSKVQVASDKPACCLFQHDPAKAPSPDVATSPLTPLQTTTCSRMLDRTEQYAPVLTCTGTSMEQDLLTTASHARKAEPVSAPCTPAAVQSTAEHSPTVYCTPHGSSPVSAHIHTAIESPSPDDQEQWYTPETIPDNTFNSQEVATHLTECAFSPGHSFSRPDSPSLLYGQGSAFSADVLDQEDNSSSHWLTI